MSQSPRPNRLAQEKSPYLLQHAYNPVDWYAYGDEAFERARQERKPVFLSIGYSTCHWCHVMERESFEDPATAEVMNSRYVNVKVDREERPDVDHVYMQAVLAITQGQGGGWPLNVWITPDGDPFYGGTYFPPDARWGRPGFKDVLRQLADFYKENSERVAEQTGQLMDALRSASRSDDEPPAVPADIGSRAVKDVSDAYDATWGGFGQAPKFPRSVVLSLLAHQAHREEHAHVPAMVAHTLEMMWRGGIYDHVGGGFARYSTDHKWLVPHFEKMLYDNALLVDAYLDGYAWTGRGDFADVVRDVLTFVAREMTHEEGGFYSAQDADSEGVEGKFYVFTPAELREALGDDAAAAMRVYGATDSGNFEGDNILFWPRSLEETADAEGTDVATLRARHEDWRGRLYAWREQRVRPGLDDKVITSWNGLMIGALARAGAIFDDGSYVAAAEKAAEFIEANLRTEKGVLLRRWRDGEGRFEASLDDHAFYAFGLLGLYQSTGKARWLARVLELLEEIEERYQDPDGDGYFFADPGAQLPVRMKDYYDGALPSGNAMAALVQARVANLLDRDDLRERCRACVRGGAGPMTRMPEAFPLLIMASQEVEEPPRTLFVVGDGESEVFRNLLTKAHGELFPGRLIVPVPDSERAAVEDLGLPLHDKPAGPEGAAGYLCEDASCRPWPGA